ncbi:MAG TPA: methyltransferase, partial [Acidimicrobiales bacterium]|nr:methyltransferase [Acidimicrobiales bacterium]
MTPGAGDGDVALEVRRLIFGQVVSQVTATVARLGVPDALGDGPRAVADLSAALDADADGLARLLRAAAALRLVTEIEPGLFALTPRGEWLRSQPPSLRDLALAIAAPGHSRSLERLPEAVVTGRPVAAEALGMDLWEYFARTPEQGAAFAAAMGNVSEVVAEELVRCFDVTRFRRIVDVGGSRGVVLAHLLAAAPAATGVLFDRPDVVAGARAELGERGLDGRVEVVGGDFLQEVPAGGDLYVLKHIVHDWNDDHAARILANCRRAAGPGTTLLLVERLSGPSADDVPYLADLL